MLRICTLQDLDDNQNAENLDLSFLSPLSINYSQVKWKNVAALVVLHAGAVAGWVLFFLGYIYWQTVLWNILFGFFSIIGITTGALSLWGHRIYDTKQPLKLFLLIAQTTASQDRIWVWVRDHRQHCEYKNTDADPFNSKRGFFFSHMGWLMMKKHPDVITKGKQTDMSDLEVDPLVMFQKRQYVAINLLLTVLQLTIPCYLWDEMAELSFLAFIARVITVFHITWCIHSLHNFEGMKPSTEEKTDGENRAQRKCIGDRCCWFDPTSIVLCICESIGLTSGPKQAE